MISQTSEYALKAALYLANRQDDNDFVRVESMAEALQVPRNYLSKILHALGREGIVESTRGPRGGFRLATPAAELTLETLLQHFDPQLFREERRCLLGRERCSDRDPCAAHDRWAAVAGPTRRFFRETTLQDLKDHPTATEAGEAVG